ncbi:uncharacterized protein MELLADRAFT_123223 [Melampsora larici-populina 98AG31]|uniref:Secreted protein n=1 Tax=Melampsora larici-populina (strain 98AG31 / pathotype 3-4-7) TaxID=747676 RepID=F4RW85_MELLP|nr:uncharacterized protein MELLADRAFT_123223 [Melampsora larici-populina 98AG31]EGG03238.1 secreted protein [Melampsora larici-populina 98AG31]
MSFFQSSHKFVIIFIAMCITQFPITNANTAKCIIGYKPFANGQNAVCHDEVYVNWLCPIKQCSKDGRQFVPMKGCVLDNVAGTSNQECSAYNFKTSGQYACSNSGGRDYTCPYTPSNVPFITCSGCKPPGHSKFS